MGKRKKEKRVTENYPLLTKILRHVLAERLHVQCDLQICQQQKYLTPQAIEKEYGFDKEILKYWRSRNIGPAYHKLFDRIYYQRDELEDFIASGRVDTMPFVDTCF